MQYSIVNYKTIKENSDFRIDAEYYHPAILGRLNLLEGKNNDFLYNLVKFIVGPFGSTVTVDKYIGKSDYRYIRNKDINDFVIGDDDPALIPENVYRTLQQFHIQKEDLLLTVVGTLGKVAIAQEKDDKSIFSCKSTLLRSQKLNPYYLLAYLNSSTGQIFSLRGKRGAIQEGLNLTDLKDIKVFIPSTNFQKFIEHLIKKSFGLLENSKSLYSQAEKLLLSELGLLDWEPEHTLAFVKNFSDTQKAERIDAEYFQPKYEEIIEAVKRYKGGFDTLENLTKLVGHPSNPPYETGSITNKTFIITQKHLANYIPADNFWKDEEALYTTDEFIEKNKKFLLQKNDIILYSVGAYIGKANLYNADIKATIGSFLTLIRPKVEKINPFYLLVFLNSKIGQELTRRNSRGLAQQYIYPYDTKQIVIPILESDKQKEIEKLIVEGQNNQTLSKSLLEVAKRGVEIAIEKDEEEAEKWINGEVKKLGVEIKKKSFVAQNIVNSRVL